MGSYVYYARYHQCKCRQHGQKGCWGPAEGGLSKKMKASCLTFLSSLALSCKANENRSTKARIQHYANQPINTSYLTESYIVFTLKMESVSKNTIFGLKMMVKSGLEKIFLKFLHAGDYFSLLHKSVQNHKFSNKYNQFRHRRISKKKFLDHFSPSFLRTKLYFWIQIPFWG